MRAARRKLSTRTRAFAMKSRPRNTPRLAKVVVSDETMARARGALQAFGVDPTSMDLLANFKGDVTIGPAAKTPPRRRSVKA